MTPYRPRQFLAASFAVAMIAALAGCGGHDNGTPPIADTGSDGPQSAEAPVVHATGNVANGKIVFRFETFGNERFWTDALRLQQGMMATGVTPIKALKLGLMVDIDALDAATQTAIAAEAKTDLSPINAPLLNDTATLVKLINANAVVGIVAKDSAGAGTIDITKGSKTGASCALCHTITDASVLNVAGGGSIGKRLDGRANHNLDFGTLIATGLNTRAYYPVLQLALAANGGKTLGRAPTGLTPTSTEAEVDAYLTNKAYYPVGMFDDTVDGNGDPPTQLRAVPHRSRSALGYRGRDRSARQLQQPGLHGAARSDQRHVSGRTCLPAQIRRRRSRQ